ncbi:hypothetical protein MKD41_00255 [Lutibacter sp. A64]|uniref:hypothetical protein n=1 Tax=Lutibacter sp. A64 TaxID=2918526 RepID=UPI001F0634BC|nr:hypothetical protein [Lutibacter sp. A64]UMB53930.1 hypothetical protein MKD41_00255 [Lutibacter sp. A64]
MKKQFLNLGKALNKAEQKQVFGGLHELTQEEDGWCSDVCTLETNAGCPAGQECFVGYCDNAQTKMCRYI